MAGVVHHRRGYPGHKHPHKGHKGPHLGARGKKHPHKGYHGPHHRHPGQAKAATAYLSQAAPDLFAIWSAQDALAAARGYRGHVVHTF